MDTFKKTYFRKNLLNWHVANPRVMPWSKENDPYKIWISEVILQQTRVKQGWGYYQEFIKTFPNVFELANAKIDEILYNWQGLGYYSRAINLHEAAKKIVENHRGVFPNTYEDIISLKGIGPYTAAAILSFGFHKPYAVLDGNVKRVYSRYFGITEEINSHIGKKVLGRLAEVMLDSDCPSEYNQAIMNFGAMQCKPGLPNCENCCMQKKCFAYQSDMITELPKKKKKKARRLRYFHYFHIVTQTEVLFRKRSKGDIWNGLYDFFLIEKQTNEALKITDTVELFNIWKQKPIIAPANNNANFTQLLSHQKIIAQFYTIETKKDQIDMNGMQNFDWISRQNIQSLAKPKIINCYLEDISISLSTN